MGPRGGASPPEARCRADPLLDIPGGRRELAGLRLGGGGGPARPGADGATSRAREGVCLADFGRLEAAARWGTDACRPSATSATGARRILSRLAVTLRRRRGLSGGGGGGAAADPDAHYGGGLG